MRERQSSKDLITVKLADTKTTMHDAAADYMDEWLEANVAGRYAVRPTPTILAALVLQCVADAKAQGVLLEDIETVVEDIEEAIQEEVEFVLAMKSSRPRH